MMADPIGAQILIREYLDGAPFLAQLAASDPVDRGAAPARGRGARAGDRPRRARPDARRGDGRRRRGPRRLDARGGPPLRSRGRSSRRRGAATCSTCSCTGSRRDTRLGASGRANGARRRAAPRSAPSGPSRFGRTLSRHVACGRRRRRRGRAGLVGRPAPRAGGPQGRRPRARRPGRGGVERRRRHPLSRRRGGRARPLLRALPRLARALPRPSSREVEALSGMSVGLRTLGTLEVALDDDHAKILAARAEKIVRHGLPVRGARRRRGAAARARRLARGARRAPLRRTRRRSIRAPLARAVYVAASRAGATFVTGQVRRIVTEGGRAVGVEHESGRIEAGRGRPRRRAAGACSSRGTASRRARCARCAGRSRCSTRARRSSRASSSRGTATSCRAPTAGSCAARRWRRSGSRRRSPRAACATSSTSRSAIAPALARAPVVETWSNFRPASPDGEPILGPGTVPGLLYATGHTRNGILLAPITADAHRGGGPRHARRPVDLAPFSPARLAGILGPRR